MSRLARKNRTDIIIKSSGGMFDLVDNAIKEVWRINDEEYDYIIDNTTDSELALFILETPTVSEVKETLQLIDIKLKDLYDNK